MPPYACEGRSLSASSGRRRRGARTGPCARLALISDGHTPPSHAPRVNAGQSHLLREHRSRSFASPVVNPLFHCVRVVSRDRARSVTCRLLAGDLARRRAKAQDDARMIRIDKSHRRWSGRGLLLPLFALASACASDAPQSEASGGAPAGTSGASAAGGSAPGAAGSAGNGLTSSGGAPSSAGAVGGSNSAGRDSNGDAGGMLGSPAGGGSSGVGGAAGGSAGGAGFAGTSGASFWGPTGPKKQWSCPPPPYPAQTLGPATNICAGFTYNYGYNEGPTWVASQNAFFFSNFTSGSNLGGDIIKYTLGGSCEVWLHEVGCNGLAVSPSGNLLAACQGPRAIMEYDLLSKKGRVVAAMVNGKLFDSPNDLVAHSNGTVYFSNTTYELGNRPKGLGEALVRIDPLGMVSVVASGSVNGVALSPDEKKLYVVGQGTWTLDDNGVPLQKGEPTPGGDGIAVDCAGTVSNTGTNSAYGGPDGKTLLAVGGSTNAKIYSATVPGLP